MYTSRMTKLFAIGFVILCLNHYAKVRSGMTEQPTKKVTLKSIGARLDESIAKIDEMKIDADCKRDLRDIELEWDYEKRRAIVRERERDDARRSWCSLFSDTKLAEDPRFTLRNDEASRALRERWWLWCQPSDIEYVSLADLDDPPPHEKPEKPAPPAKPEGK